MIRNSIKFLLILSLLALSVCAKAGSVEDGPFVVWVNLSKNPYESDQKLRTFLNSGKARCWNDKALLFMLKKPKEITRDLVKRALVQRNHTAIKRLNMLLKQPFRQANDGFDGIVAYSENSKSLMYSLTTGSRKIEQTTVDLNVQANDFEVAFCGVLPEISRGASSN